MSPRITFLLTLAGVILVGVPLHHLTQPVAPIAAPRPGEQAESRLIYANIRFTGQPGELRLRAGKQEDWVSIETTRGEYDFELEMPITGMLELEVEGHWESPDAQAVTLTLEPDGLETRSDTQWKDEYSNTLHSIFRFSW